MTSAFTPNKGIEQPAEGDYVDTWDVPVNRDWSIIDTAFGGVTTINVTGVSAGTIALTLAQYTPPNIEFTGLLTGTLNYQIPTGVGGTWSIRNSTTGSFTLQFSIASGNAFTLASGRTLIISNGMVITTADDATAAAAASVAQANAENFATAQAASALSQARALPINFQGGNYTLALSDRGSGVCNNSPSNVSYIIPLNIFSDGDVVTLIAPASASITVVPASGITLQWAGNGATAGTRVLTGAGICTLFFITSALVIVGGSGLS